MKNTILGLGNNLKFYYYQHPVNMGKGIEALKGLVVNEFGMSLDEKSVFVFISKNHKEIKLLHYEDHIYTLYVRKIYGGRFIYPCYNPTDDTYRLDWSRLRKLLRGYRYTRYSN